MIDGIGWCHDSPDRATRHRARSSLTPTGSSRSFDSRHGKSGSRTRGRRGIGSVTQFGRRRDLPRGHCSGGRRALLGYSPSSHDLGRDDQGD